MHFIAVRKKSVVSHAAVLMGFAGITTGYVNSLVWFHLSYSEMCQELF